MPGFVLCTGEFLNLSFCQKSVNKGFDQVFIFLVHFFHFFELAEQFFVCQLCRNTPNCKAVPAGGSVFSRKNRKVKCKEPSEDIIFSDHPIPSAYHRQDGNGVVYVVMLLMK